MFRKRKLFRVWKCVVLCFECRCLSFKFANIKGSIVSVSAVTLKMSDSPVRSTLLTSHIPSYNKMAHVLIWCLIVRTLFILFTDGNRFAGALYSITLRMQFQTNQPISGPRWLGQTDMWSKWCHRVLHPLLGLETAQMSMQVHRGRRYLPVNADYHGHTEVIPHIALKFFRIIGPLSW